MALIAISLARRHGLDSLDELADSLDVRLGTVESGRYVRCAKRPSSKSLTMGSSGGRPTARDANPNADPEHPFYGKVIVFTGSLQSKKRQQAWNDVSEVGGLPEQSVTKRTNILVVGDLSPNTSPGIRPLQQGSARRRTAEGWPEDRGHDRGRLPGTPLKSLTRPTGILSFTSGIYYLMITS